jgi:dGTPase
MNIREKLEQQEHQTLSNFAAMSDQSRGRPRPEGKCSIRPEFQRDRDRIVHSKPFRRLKHKTQVFLAPAGDHYRTRLTHTIEVNQIARTIAKALFLNESLTEAIALGHDLGHTPFGHAGEFALDQICPNGFRHWEQSLRVVDCLANDDRGLNLTYEVRNGILKHSKGKVHPFLGNQGDGPYTMEGKIVRAADIIAYVNHDLEDALQAGVISVSEIPRECLKVLGDRHSRRINTMVSDLVYTTEKSGKPWLSMSAKVQKATECLRDWLFEKVYENPVIKMEFDKGVKVLSDLFRYLTAHPADFKRIAGKSKLRSSVAQEVCDFVAGMTDSYALKLYQELFMPTPWD